MSVFERLLHEVEQHDSTLLKALNSYIQDSRVLEPEQARLVIDFVQSHTLSRPTRLERIQSSDPEWNVGDRVSYNVKSFTKKRVSEGEKAGHIAWKSSDGAIILIENATRGWEVDYDVIKVWFAASEEKEVLVYGDYRVAKVTRIVEPGTNPAYGYTVPCYVLQET